MFLNYPELSTEYKKNLDEKLRGFSGGPGFLETWTDDEDPKAAISDLFDLAIADGHEIITVYAPEAAMIIQNGGYKDGVLVYDGSGKIVYRTKRVLDLTMDLHQILSTMRHPHDVTIASLKDDILVLSYEEVTPERPLHYDLIKIEDYLNERNEKKVNIQTLNVEDKNKRKCRM